VAAAAELGEVVIGEVLDELAETGIRPEEVLPDIGAAGDRELLELAVERVVHLLDEDPVDIAGEELVPLAGPDHLDHVPAGAAEGRFQLLDDLAVAANRAVEPLQVAVDDEGQVVEALAGGEIQCPECLRLVGLAVAQERPDAVVRRVLDALAFGVGSLWTAVYGAMIHKETLYSHYATMTGLIYVGDPSARDIAIPVYGP